MIRIPTLVAALAAAWPAWTQAQSLTLDTVAGNTDVHWLVAEVAGGTVVPGEPVFGVVGGSGVPALTIPFTDNDGYWIAATSFTLPAGATSPTLTIAAMAADDRVVLLLNGRAITDCGTTSSGGGFMTFRDGGPNQPLFFFFPYGPENITVTTGFVPGLNRIEAIVNNTNRGIHGVPVPVTPSSPSSFGLTATVSYTTAAP